MLFYRKSVAVLLCVLLLLSLLPIATPTNHASAAPIVTLDTADSLSGWTSGNTLSLDTTNKLEGTASIRMTGADVVQFEKVFSTSVDTHTTIQNGMLNFWYYIEDASKLVGTFGQVEISSSGRADVDEIAWDYNANVKQVVQNGWNLIRLPFSQASITGSPDLANINYMRIYFLNSQAATANLDTIFFEEHDPNAVVWDHADSLDGWNSDNTLSLDMTERAEGIASISMAGSGAAEFAKTFTLPLNTRIAPDAAVLNFYYYIADITKLTSGSVAISSSGSAGSNAYVWDLDALLPELANGWNLISLKQADAAAIGSPDLSALNFFSLTMTKTGGTTSKLDMIYFDELEGLPTQDYIGTSTSALVFDVANSSDVNDNKYVYRKAVAPGYTFKAGDYIEYDVWIDADIDGAGGIEISTFDGSNLRGTGWKDQNGISGHPGSDLSDYAYGQWYHRKLRVPTQAIGQPIGELLLVGENDTPSLSYSASYRNIVVTDRMGNLQQVLFDSPIDYNQFGVAYSSGVTNSSIASGYTPNAPDPAVYTPDYPSDDVIIAGFNVLDYSADPTGTSDSTDAFRQALLDCAYAGGGVVWAPNGTYKLLGNLQIPVACTLRGDWKQPADNDLEVEGTVLLAYAGRGSSTGRAFLSLDSGAGVRNLAIYYPEQTIAAVTPYPYAISMSAQSGTAMNLTLVNAYNGLTSSVWHNSMHYIRNVYGTPLQAGIFLEHVYDVGRIEELVFSPKYWADSGLPGAPSFGAITAYTQGGNGSVGIAIGRNDWEVMNDVTIENYATGVKLFDSNGHSNGSIYNLTVTGARIGILADSTNPIGWLVSASSVEATAGPDPIAVLLDTSFQNMSLQFNKTSFAGSGTAVRQLGNGLSSFVNSSFQSWGATKTAIEVEQGTVLVQGSEFAAATGAQKHIWLGSTTSSASILSNDYGGTPVIANDAPLNTEIAIDHAARTYESISGAPYVRAVHPQPSLTGSSDFYNVLEAPYSAAADGATDDTAAIQDALDDAGTAGGGTVYLPAGKYRVNGTLSVPAGVELRGAQDVPFHTTSEGTVLLAYTLANKGLEAGTPFISLQSDAVIGGSGIRGVMVWYPEQSVDDFTPYPWAIQSQGPNCWVIYTNVTNAYQGVDFGTYNNNGHVLDYLAGAGVKTGLFVGNTSTEGWVENVHFNPMLWLSSTLPRPDTNSVDSAFQKLWPWQKANGTPFLFGYVENGHVSETFLYGAKDGIRFIEQPSLGSFHGTILNHGTDGAKVGARFSAVDAQGIDFINFEAVQFDNGHFVVVDPTVSSTAPIRLFNTNHWTSPSVGYDIQGGNLLLQQGHFTDGGTNAIKATGGTVRVQASYFAAAMPQHIYNSGATATVMGSAAAGGLTTFGTVTQDENVAR